MEGEGQVRSIDAVESRVESDILCRCMARSSPGHVVFSDKVQGKSETECYLTYPSTGMRVLAREICRQTCPQNSGVRSRGVRLNKAQGGIRRVGSLSRRA